MYSDDLQFIINIVCFGVGYLFVSQYIKRKAKRNTPLGEHQIPLYCPCVVHVDFSSQIGVLVNAIQHGLDTMGTAHENGPESIHNQLTIVCPLLKGDLNSNGGYPISSCALHRIFTGLTYGWRLSEDGVRTFATLVQQHYQAHTSTENKYATKQT